MTTLGIIIASARPNRVGEHVARWVSHTVGDAFEVDIIDLREVGLPAFDEPSAPRSGAEKTTDHGREWARRIGGLDAAVVLTPQYNGSYPGALKNAVDFLYAEWNDLPMILVGYAWREASEVLPMLEALMTRVGARVVDTIGLAFGEDLSVEGEMTVREQKQAQLQAAAQALTEDVPAHAH